MSFLTQIYNVGASWFGGSSKATSAPVRPTQTKPPATKVKVCLNTIGRTVEKATVVVGNKVDQAANDVAGKVNSVRNTVEEVCTSVKQKVATRTKEGQLKHERNVFLYYLACSKGKLEMYPAKDIAVAVDYCVAQAKKGNLSDKDKADIRFFFLDKLSSMPEDKFNRRLLLGGKDALQRIISPELDRLLTEQEQNPSLKDSKQHQLDIAVARAQLAVGVGAGTSRAGGCNGAVIVKSLEGKAVGVFKAPPSNAGFDPARQVKAWFGQARLFNREDKMNEPYSEVAMHYFDEVFGFNLAPAAKQVELKDESGAFLAFLGGYKELADVVEDLNKRDSFEKDELIKWQTAMVAIFASLNFDPHAGNIFVQMDKGQLSGLKIIDAGNNFAARLPGEWGTKGHRSEPGDLAISKKPFEPEVIEFIKTRLTEENLNSFIAKVKADRPDFWTAEMDVLHRQTLQIVRKNVANGMIASPFELLNILTPGQYAEQKKVAAMMDDWTIVDIGDDEAEMVKNAAVVVKAPSVAPLIIEDYVTGADFKLPGSQSVAVSA